MAHRGPHGPRGSRAPAGADATRWPAARRAYLAGHGADAVFAGMPRHRLLWLRDHAPPPLRGALDELFLLHAAPRAAALLAGAAAGELRVSRATCRQLPAVTGAHARARSIRRARRRLAAMLDDHVARTKACASTSRWKPTCDVTMVTPFFDPAVVEFALGCPTSFLIDARRAEAHPARGGERSAAAPDVAQRRKLIQRMKHDTAAVGRAGRFRERAAAARIARRAAAWLRPNTWRRCRSAAAGAAYSSERLHILWAMVCAELWLRQFIDERGAAGPELSKDGPAGREAPKSVRFATA